MGYLCILKIARKDRERLSGAHLAELKTVIYLKEPVANPFMYAGEYYDLESDLYYLRARYYAPEIGRFISRDTYEGQVTSPMSLNLYTYCSNNPIRFVDPSGHVQVEGTSRDGKGNVTYRRPIRGGRDPQKIEPPKIFVKNPVVTNPTTVGGFSNTTITGSFANTINTIVTNSDTIKSNLKSTTKDVVKDVIKPAVVFTLDKIAETDKTYTIGVVGSGSPSFWNIGGSAQLSIDTKGGIAVQATPLIGGMTSGTPGISVGLFKSSTNAPRVEDLTGFGSSFGGSVALPAYFGADINVFKNSDTGVTYFGNTVTVGYGSPSAELHVEWGETNPVWRWNYRDILRDVYHQIMEW